MRKLITLFTALFITTTLFAQRPIVQDIQAVAGKGRTINVNWTLPENPDEPITELQIYKSDRQISSYEQIEKLQPIAYVSPSTTNYQDTANDFKDYYYAVIAVTSKPCTILIASVNATVNGAHLIPKKNASKVPQKKIEEKLYTDGQIRETPLPFVSFVDGMNQEDIITPETAEAVKSLSFTKEKKNSLLRPYIFEEDLVSPDGGDDYLLFDILKNYFAPKKYSEAIIQLEKLIGTNISQKTRNRAYFYIGESEYFIEDYNKAIMYFVKVESIYPIQAKRWIDSSLDQL